MPVRVPDLAPGEAARRSRPARPRSTAPPPGVRGWTTTSATPWLARLAEVPGGEGRTPATTTWPTATSSPTAARRCRVRTGDSTTTTSLAVRRPHTSCMATASAPAGSGAPGHDADRLPRRRSPRRSGTGQDRAHHRQAVQRCRGRRCGRVGSPQGEPVHRGVHERGDGLGGGPRRTASRSRAHRRAATGDRAATRRTRSEDERLGPPPGGSSGVTSSMPWAHSAQSTPPDQVSRFQIGTVRFSVSMQCRAASKASPPVGRERHTTTDTVSPTSSRPGPVEQDQTPDVRPATARAEAATRPSRGTASSAKTSYSSAVTSTRPGEWSRTVPRT